MRKKTTFYLFLLFGNMCRLFFFSKIIYSRHNLCVVDQVF